MTGKRKRSDSDEHTCTESSSKVPRVTNSPSSNEAGEGFEVLVSGFTGLENKSILYVCIIPDRCVFCYTVSVGLINYTGAGNTEWK